MSRRVDRRDLLKVGGTVTAATGLALLGSTSHARALRRSGSIVSEPIASDLAVMQGALALEHEGIAAYRLAAGSGLLSHDTIAVAGVFLGHHQGHRDALARLIAKAGGKPVEPKSDSEYTSSLGLARLKSEADVVRFAAGLEQGAANAYVGQVAALRDGKLARLFSQLGTDEAVHWALLNSAAGGTVPKRPFLFG
ncbi:MAG TPA: DUF4439 domain-containing protein [Sphingomicrobium sp.]|nr:DUF4439 domain-containing protein [Sphingomicrobium sp.]